MKLRTVTTLLFAALLGFSGAQAGFTNTPGIAADCDITVQAGDSIQAGVNAAAAGDTVCIEPGTYTGTVSFGKPLTLQGADRDSVVIDVSGTNQRGISVTTSTNGPPIQGVTIRSLTVTGPGSGASFGVHIVNVEDLLVEDIVVQASSRSELDLHGVRNGIVRNSAFHGQDTSGTGFQMTDSHDIEVDNIVTSGNTWGGMAVFAGGCCMPEKGSSDVRIRAGSSFAEPIQMYTQTHRGASVTDLVLEDLRYRVDAVLPTTHVFYFQDEPSAFAHALTLGATATVLDLETGAYLVGPGMNLARAVQAAPAHGTVEVRAGTHPLTTTVSVTKPMAILGPNADVSPTDGAVRAPEAVITSADPDRPVRRALRIATDDPGVTVAGLTFENAGTAIWTSGANHVKDLVIEHNVFVGGTEAYGSSAAAPQHPNRVDGLSFVNNVVADNALRAFSFYTGVQGTDFNVSGNEVTDSYGIHLGFVDGATVADNEIAIGLDSWGILLADDIGDVTVTGNTITGNDTAAIGLYVWGKTNFHGDVLVEGNTITGHTMAGIDIRQFENLTTDVSNWTVRWNAFEDNALGVTSQGTGTLDARFNWWGDATGPLVDGDGVSPLFGVKVTPWCLDASCSTIHAAQGPLGQVSEPLPL